MKEAEVGNGTCGCKYCRWGHSHFDKKQRNKKRRLHIRREIIYLRTLLDMNDSKFKMPNYSVYTD